MNRLIVCDKTWYSEIESIKHVEYDELIVVDFKTDFSYLVLNEVSKRKNDIICIIGKKYDEHLDSIDNIIKFAYNNHNMTTVRSVGMNDFDFSNLSVNGTAICFPAKIFDSRPDVRRFNTIIELQKYFLLTVVNSKKHYLFLLNDKNKFKKVETNEDKRIKKVRYSPPKTRDKAYKIGERFYRARNIDSDPVGYSKDGKPRIVFVCDVEGWAWWIKSNYIKKYLENYYDIDIVSMIDGKRRHFDQRKYDICFTYGYSYVARIQRANFDRRVAGVTAHRPMEVIKPKLDKVKWVHANSLLLYNEIERVFKNTFYVPNGVDEQLFYPRTEVLSNGKMTFGHVGKLSVNKGQREYIEPAVNKAGVKYFSHYNNYRTRVKHTDMPNIHHKYDVFVCASEEDGTPCPALEAAACGRPIISNRIGNMPELVENYKTGILLDGRKVDDYVDAIKWCQDNPDKVKEMGKNIRKRIETEWTWRLMARNYLHMFDRILGIDRGLSYYENPALYHGI